MTTLRLLSFRGLQPRTNRQLLDGHAATLAENVRLWHGTLQGFRVPAVVDPRGAPHRSIFLTDAGWLSLPGVDDVVAGLPGCPRVLAAGEDFPYPVWAGAADAVAGRWRRLGLPAPPMPQAIPNQPPRWAFPNDRSLEVSAYVLTYLDSFGNEGPASDVSERFGVDDGVPVQVTWAAVPGGGWDIAAIRLYRLVASDEGELQIDNPHTEVFSLVAELDASSTHFIDAVPNLALDEPLISQTYIAPPPGLTHLVAQPSGTQLAGAVGRNVYFCEPHEFHAWPEKYTLTLDDAVVAMVWTDHGLVVATDGYPYWISPAVDEQGQREVIRMTESLPCIARRSMVATPTGGALYAHADGLVRLTGKGTPELISQNYWASDDFAALDPATMIAEAYGGYLFAFTSNTGFVLDLREATYPGSDGGLVTLTSRPTALHRSRTDQFYLALPEGIAEWDAGSTYLAWRYRTRLNVMPGQMNFAAAKLVYEAFPYTGTWTEADTSTHFRLLTDDRERYAREVRHSNPFRLPHLSRNLGFEIELSRPAASTKGEIREVCLASSVSDLTQSEGAA